MLHFAPATFLKSNYLRRRVKLTFPQKQILYALSQFYQSLNQPLVKTLLHLQTSKIAFIELLLDSKLLAKHERAVYKNLETLEKKKIIAYQNRMIRFTETGLKELQKIEKEVELYGKIGSYFQTSKKPKRKLQTTLD